MSNGGKILLLLNSLRDCEQTKRDVVFVKDLKFPSQVNYTKYYRVLEFDKKDRIEEWKRLASLVPLTKDSTQNFYNELRHSLWKSCFEQNIEKLVMEKTEWAARIRIAGNFKRELSLFFAK